MLSDDRVVCPFCTFALPLSPVSHPSLMPSSSYSRVVASFWSPVTCIFTSPLFPHFSRHRALLTLSEVFVVPSPPISVSHYFFAGCFRRRLHWPARADSTRFAMQFHSRTQVIFLCECFPRRQFPAPFWLVFTPLDTSALHIHLPSPRSLTFPAVATKIFLGVF